MKTVPWPFHGVPCCVGSPRQGHRPLTSHRALLSRPPPHPLSPERGIVQICLLSHSIVLGTKDVNLRGRQSGLGRRRRGRAKKSLEEWLSLASLACVPSSEGCGLEGMPREAQELQSCSAGNASEHTLTPRGPKELAQTLSCTSSELGHRKCRCTWLRGGKALSRFWTSSLRSFPLMR